MVGIRRSDHQCIRIGDGGYEHAGIASRNDDHLVSYASSVEHNGQIGRLERFSQPSRIDSKPLLGAVGGKDKKKNIPVAVHLLCLRLQCCSKRFDGRIAAGLGVESYDNRVGSKSVRDDFSCPGRLSAKNALTTEQTERRKFERTQRSSSAGSIGRQKEPVAHPDRRRLANRWSLRRLGETENGDDADTHRAKTMERSKRRRSKQSHQNRARSRRSSGWSLNRPIDHAVDLARHDKIVLVQSLDLL